MRTNVPLKALIVGGVALAFMVPLGMIWRVVEDRSSYRDTVTAEVARSTAQSQTLVGPLVVVRYREVLPAAVKGGGEQIREGTEILLPDSLSTSATS
jgi:inner membrane protein